MTSPSVTLPRPTFTAVLPRTTDGTVDAPARSTPARLAGKALGVLRAHWKPLAMAAVGLIGWRSKRLRPLLRKAAMFYAAPMAKRALARVRA